MNVICITPKITHTHTIRDTQKKQNNAKMKQIKQTTHYTHTIRKRHDINKKKNKQNTQNNI